MIKNLLLFALFASGMVHSQNISKSVVASCGNSQKSNAHQVSWTVGETVVGFLQNNDAQLGSGYYPSMKLQPLSVQDQSLVLETPPFPNPALDFLNVVCKECQSIHYQVFDSSGKLIQESNLANEQKILVTTLAVGVYLIKISDSATQKSNTYQFIKQ